MKATPAQILLTLSAFTLLIEPFGDGWLGMGMLVENHTGSSAWPDHAKFHVVRQAFACIFTGLACAWGILKFWHCGRGVRWVFSLLPFLVNISAILSVTLAPIWGIENPVSDKGLGVVAISSCIILTIAGLILESKEHKKLSQ